MSEDKKTELNDLSKKLAKIVIDNWAHKMFAQTNKFIRFHVNEKEYHGGYFSEGSQNISGYCTLPHEKKDSDSNGYTICPDLEWKEDTTFVVYDETRIYLNTIEEKIKTLYKKQLEELLKLEEKDEKYEDLYCEILDDDELYNNISS